MTLTQTINNNKNKYAMVYRQKTGICVTAEWIEGRAVDQVSQLHDKDMEFDTQLSFYKRQCFAAEQGFDNVPLVAFDFGRAAWLIALAYGCPMSEMNGLISAKYLYNSMDEAMQLQKAEKIWQEGLYPVIVERIEDFQSRYGDIPISISDNQSPNDVLTSIINSQEVMIGMFTDKDKIHSILDTLTESIIEMNRYFEKIIKNFAGFQCAKYLPFGIHISDDNAAFLSPETYAEFSKPYNERLAEEFGGIAFHCCMGHEQNLENMASTKNFLGFDAMPDYNDIEKIISTIQGKGVWNVYNYGWATKDERRLEASDEKWFKNIIDRADGRVGLILNVFDENKEDALRLADSIREYVEKA